MVLDPAGMSLPSSVHTAHSKPGTRRGSEACKEVCSTRTSLNSGSRRGHLSPLGCTPAALRWSCISFLEGFLCLARVMESGFLGVNTMKADNKVGDGGAQLLGVGSLGGSRKAA